MAEKSKRGFASMDAAKQRQIASKGGKAAHAKGTAHQFTPAEAKEAGRKGGQAVSRNRRHMAEIGRRGGEAVSQDREHMAEIGREGGERSRGEQEIGMDNRRPTPEAMPPSPSPQIPATPAPAF
jgi:general stress protein YciG